MHMKILYNQRQAELLESGYEDSRIFEGAEDSDDVAKLPPEWSEWVSRGMNEVRKNIRLWDPTDPNTIIRGNLKIRFIDTPTKRHHNRKDIEITIGDNKWTCGYGWSIELNNGDIYSTGASPKELRCYKLEKINRRNVRKCQYDWKVLPSTDPIAAKMIAEVEENMNFN
jgi:hypothetical protein